MTTFETALKAVFDARYADDIYGIEAKKLLFADGHVTFERLLEGMKDGVFPPYVLEREIAILKGVLKAIVVPDETVRAKIMSMRPFVPRVMWEAGVETIIKQGEDLEQVPGRTG